MDEKDINRLLMQFERLLRTSNRDAINPAIEELSIDGLKPLIDLVAKSRADYLSYVYTLSKQCNENDTVPSGDEFKKLKTLRLRFEELTSGAQAFETSIQRGYLDLKV